MAAGSPGHPRTSPRIFAAAVRRNCRKGALQHAAPKPGCAPAKRPIENLTTDLDYDPANQARVDTETRDHLLPQPLLQAGDDVLTELVIRLACQGDLGPHA